MPRIDEVRAYITEYCTTTDTTPRPLGADCASIAIGEAFWLHARVKASTSTRSWYTEYMFFARRAAAGAPVIYSKSLLSYEPEGKVNWKVELRPVGLNAVGVVVIGQVGVTIDWAVSTRGYKKNA